MKSIENIGLTDVQAVYSGPEGELWELVMGEQIHIGGFVSSMTLAEQAGIAAGMRGVDLCCCNGAGMRFLVRFRNVASMVGVDATETVVNRGRERCAEEGLSDRVRFTLADVCASGLADEEARRFLTFMKFPNVQDIDGYADLLKANGCAVAMAEDTGQFARHCDLYLDMLNMQLTYDALKIIGFNAGLMAAMGKEMAFMRDLAHMGKIAQARFIATSPD